MKFRNKHNSNEENFWLSATDMMAGILVVVLLLLMLFLLYLNMSTDEVYTPMEETTHTGVAETTYEHEDGGYTTPPIPTQPTYAKSENGGEGGGGTEAAATEPPTEKEIITDEKGEERAAVFVKVVDADSGNVIKKSGISFELYSYKNGAGSLQPLSTYYQEKTEYRKFETGDNGTFYLPEKLRIGHYSLHNLSAPDGYVVDEKTPFEITESSDWPDPIHVTVNMRPIKKTIRITVEDADTGEGLTGVEFEIVAAKDSKSSSVAHYADGDVVDRVKSNEKGYAESRELYVGSYYVRQTSAPEYYAVDQKAIATSISDSSDSETGMVKVECPKTSVRLRLIDERTEDPIKGAVYTIVGKKEYTTDENGEIVVDNLEKTSSYKLSLSSLPKDYKAKNKELDFKVDRNGLINDKAIATYDETAYAITLTVEAKDIIFGRTAKGVDLQLLDENESVIDEWTTNDSTYIRSGLKAGRYYVQRFGDEGSRTSVLVEDKAELQSVQVRVWDTVDLFALLMAAGAVVILGLIIGFILNRKKKVKRKNEKS